MKSLGIDTIPSSAKKGATTDASTNGAHKAIDRVSEALHPSVTRVASGAHHLVDRISNTSNKVVQGLEKTAGRLKDTEQRVVSASSNYVRENPLKSAGIALAAGFLVSQLVTSRKSPNGYDEPGRS